MKILLVPLLALATLTGAAHAQPTPPAGAPPAVGAPAEPGDDAGAPPPPPPPGGPAPMAERAGGPPPDGPRGRRPPPPPPSKAAHFHLSRGDTVLDVKCADDEPMNACGNLALQMLDHLQGGPKN